MDIEKIYEYTILNFGYKKAKEYIQNIHSKINSITKHQIEGRKVSFIHEDLRKFEVESHVIFYKPISSTILIVRILHKSMDVLRHL